jgi:hypothetical protein
MLSMTQQLEGERDAIFITHKLLQQDTFSLKTSDLIRRIYHGTEETIG